MFEKVLIVEEFDIIHSGLKVTLGEIQIKSSAIEHVSYYDEAFLKLKKGILENGPHDLLICNLFFLEDYKAQEITSGKDFIEKVRQEFPILKIIVFSTENKPFIIWNLHKNLKINAYVLKNRNGQRELKKAIYHISSNDDFYISEDLHAAIHPKKEIKVSEYDILIIKFLSDGFLQENISAILKEKGISPSSRSAIEKKIKYLKEYFNANNSTHLVAISKDLGLI